MDAFDAILDAITRYDDAGWNESDHPRDADGKFSSTGGGGAGKASAGTIPKIAASQGKPYEHIFNAAHAPDLSDDEKIEKINSLISDFQNKYKGGYLKSISKYGDNVKTAMETGAWPGKKKGEGTPAVEPGPLDNFKINEPEVKAAAPNKDFAKDGPKAADIAAMNELASKADWWKSASGPSTIQKKAADMWDEIQGAKELSDTAKQYKETLAQIKPIPDEESSHFATMMNKYLQALKEEAGLGNGEEPLSDKPEVPAPNKDFAKDGPKSATVFKTQDLAGELEYWGSAHKDKINMAQKSALEAWEEIKAAKELSDTPQQYKDTLAQIKVNTKWGANNENSSAFAEKMNKYLQALKEEAGLGNGEEPSSDKPEVPAPSQTAPQTPVKPMSEAAVKLKHEFENAAEEYYSATAGIGVENHSLLTKKKLALLEQVEGQIADAFKVENAEDMAYMIQSISDIPEADANSSVALGIAQDYVDQLKKEYKTPEQLKAATADVHKQWEDVLKAHLNGTAEDDYTPEDVAASGVMSNIDKIVKGPGSDYEKAQLLDSMGGVAELFNDDDELTGFAKTVADHLTKTVADYKAKASSPEPEKVSSPLNSAPEISTASADYKDDLKSLIPPYANAFSSITKNNAAYAQSKIDAVENAFQTASTKEELASMIHAIDTSDHDMNSTVAIKAHGLVEKLKKEHPHIAKSEVNAPNASPTPVKGTAPTQVPLTDYVKDIGTAAEHHIKTYTMKPMAKKKALAKLSYIASTLKSAEAGNMAAVTTLANLSKVDMPKQHSPGVSKVNQYVAALNKHYQDVLTAKEAAKSAPPAPATAPATAVETPLPPKKYTDLSAATNAAGDEVTKSLIHMTSEVNKKAVQEGLSKIDVAMQKPSFKEQKEAIKQLKPLNMPGSMGAGNHDKYLKELKADYGIADEPAPVSPTSSSAAFKSAVEKLITAPTVKTKSWTRLKGIFDKAYSTDKGLTTEVIPSATGEYWGNIDKKTIGAFKTYTGSTYTAMNTALRENQPLTGNLLEQVHAMDDLFEEDHANVKQDMKVWRGEKVPEKRIAEWENALKNNLPARYGKAGFISTRTKPSGYADGANVQFEIVVPKGHKAINIQPISNHPSEMEVLMRHGQNFEILEIEKANSYSNQRIVRMVAI